MPSEVLCYNKGCAKKFDPVNNEADACVHHPGVPVFHDALKGWSCCKRRTTDFSDFLNIPGCTKSPHNCEKPAEPVAPKVTSSKPKGENEKCTEVGRNKQSLPKPIFVAQRPSVNEPTIPLPVNVTPSLQKALEKLSLNAEDKADDKEENAQTWVCKHMSCNVTYGTGINQECVYHPGGPVFHEGMKYWTCCQRKTSDFTSFLAQEGCMKGTHEWKVKPLVENTPCRYDWHQTGSVVVISIFAKTAVAENTSVKVNQVSADIDLEFERGTRHFSLAIELDGVIDPTKSFVTLHGTKAEITFKKADASHWKMLNVPKTVEEKPDETEEHPEMQKNTENDMKTVNNSDNVNKDDDDSDLSGIDDTEFD